MAQMRQSKLKVNSNKLFRKSYVLAVIHKMKPFISDRYAQYITEEAEKMNIPDYIDVHLNRAFVQHQRENIENFIDHLNGPFKPFWHNRSGQGSSSSLPIIGEPISGITLREYPSDSNDNVHQSVERLNNTSTNLNRICAIRYNTADTKAFNSIQQYLITEFFMSSKNFLPLVKCVLHRDLPLRGYRTEIDINQLKTLLQTQIYLKYLHANAVILNRKNSNLAMELSDQQQLDEIDFTEVINSNAIDYVPTYSVVGSNCWLPFAETFVKFIVAYLVVFCIVAFILAFVL